jgi:hypothetical protein
MAARIRRRIVAAIQAGLSLGDGIFVTNRFQRPKAEPQDICFVEADNGIFLVII